MQSIQLATLNVDELRTRLRKMSDEELRKFGEAGKYMISPKANMGKPPLPDFVVQLEEARAEWRRRQRRARPDESGCIHDYELAAAASKDPRLGRWPLHE